MSILKKYKHELMLILSALSGFIIAIGQRTEWQDPVELGQVLAKLVIYPPDNPVYIYSIKVWSLLNQSAAVALHAGLSEFATSLSIEGLIGATSFAGIYLISLAISNNPLVALLTPLLMYSLSLVGASGVYQITLMGSSASFGIMGLSFILLVTGLLGTGKYRTGAFMAGIAPAIHPVLGAFCWLIVSLAILTHNRILRPQLLRIFCFFLFGAALTAVSLYWQLQLTSSIPGIDPVLKKSYLEAYIRNFDYHRAVDNKIQPFILGIMAAIVSLLACRKKNVPVGARIVLTSITASMLVTIALIVASEYVPPFYFIKMFIPGRFTNYANICNLPLCFGILSANHIAKGNLCSTSLISAISICFAWRLLHLQKENIIFFILLFHIMATLTFRLPDLPAKPFDFFCRKQWMFVVAIIVLLFIRQVLPGARALLSHNITLRDRTNTEILQTISSRPGTLLTAGNMHLIQLTTRRPVLMDGGALDMFPYILDAAPHFNEILQKIYGLDIFVTPPPEIKNKGVLTYFHKSLWELRSVADWQKIRAEFGVTDVLTPITWKLQLPIIMKKHGISDIPTAFILNEHITIPPEESGMTLYTIPVEPNR